MINGIIKWCLKNRFLVLVALVAILAAGAWAVRNTPIDAIPDIGVNQQIVFVDWPGRSPKDVEDQVVYPLTINLLGVPGVEVIRSNSMFGFGMINIVFEDKIDFYWSRTRVLERMNLDRNGPDWAGQERHQIGFDLLCSRKITLSSMHCDPSCLISAC